MGYWERKWKVLLRVQAWRSRFQGSIMISTVVPGTHSPISNTKSKLYSPPHVDRTCGIWDLIVVFGNSIFFYLLKGTICRKPEKGLVISFSFPFRLRELNPNPQTLHT